MSVHWLHMLPCTCPHTSTHVVYMCFIVHAVHTTPVSPRLRPLSSLFAFSHSLHRADPRGPRPPLQHRAPAMTTMTSPPFGHPTKPCQNPHRSD
ncbi:hypothetical protein COCSADRAFT_235830 [Bipolaris sorokiniana ND90Pr]|uniref:Uncharacterized protein n=1 Tax=Cochliobolus sativus (strain ND90Pr / ATCC 201652) TaxID=665912 RepID=M2SUN1_COCSN|nr:uncharacterized protein COCSADRAFT_235830 [Bipolaris sorokiniana ND90Pr]EMD60776.1 hypothetical protein COCSADRAFT_235830 [Bipolaris sorokiniana ND90Pr]